MSFNRVERYWSGSKKLLEEPLFANYLFVRGTELQHKELKQIYGIVNLVYWLGKPVVITDLDIEAMKRFLNENINVTLEKTTVDLYDSEGKEDNMAMEQNRTVPIVKNKKVYIILSSIGYIMAADVETQNIKLISSERQLILSKFTRLSY